MSDGIRRRIAGAVVVGLVIAGSMSGSGALASDKPESRSGEHAVVVTFTKWLTVDGFPWMAGVVGGAVGEGTFAGEVLACTWNSR